jgi:NTE family protein
MGSESTIDDAKRKLLEDYFKLPSGEGKAIAEELATVHLDGGQALFQQGDETDSMYLLVRGRLQVWIDAEPPIYIGEVSPGESVGEVGLITGEKRSAAVLAIRNSVLVKLDKSDFERLAAEHPAMVMQLASVVAKRLHQNTSGVNNKSRPAPSIICVRALDDTESLVELTSSVTEALENHGNVLTLSVPDMLKNSLPFCPSSESDQLSEDFQHWFSRQESEYRFIVLVCSPIKSRWSEFAESQSDLILLLANATADPSLREFEIQGSTPQKHIKHNVILLQHESETISGARAWLQPRTVDYHLHIRGSSERDLARVGRVLSGNANGLVLGGGAARGFAHVGIYRALCEANVPIDWVGGTSIGAIIGAAISLYEDADLIEEKVRDAFVDGKPFGDFTLPLVSILAGQRMNALTQKFMPGDIENLAIPFFAISSDISTGDINVHESGPIWRATGASAALPGVLPPMIYKNALAVDGAVLNNLPVDVMAAKPIGKIYASILTAKDQDEITFEDIPSPWQILLDRVVPARRRKDMPGLAALLFKATEVANRKRTNDLAASADVLFRPPVQDFNLLRVDHFDQVVEVGYVHACGVITASQPDS